MGGKKKRQAVEEEEVKPKTLQMGDMMDKSDMDMTEFLCFLPQDAIYSTKAYNLKDEKLKLVMREILKQLNSLRYLAFKEFWATIQFNVSVKKCLESCLMYFHRKKYNQYLRRVEQVNPDPNNSIVEYQRHLFKILLVVYFRILQSADENAGLTKQFKCYEAIYDSWIFDIPKLFNFMDIYGESNKDITKLLVHKVFEVNADYRLDFVDTLSIIGNKIFPDLMQQIKFIHDRSEFDQSLTQIELKKRMKIFLTIKDIYSSLLNSLEFFPVQASVNIVTYAQILVPLENVFYELYNAYKNWAFQKFGDKMHTLIDGIQSDVIALWVKIFQMFRTILLQERDLTFVKDYGEIKRLAKENLNRLFEEFGIVVSQGKKGRDKRNYMLLQQVMESFDLKEFLNDLEQIQIKNVDYSALKGFSEIVGKMTALKEKRLREELKQGNDERKSVNRDKDQEEDREEEPTQEDRELSMSPEFKREITNVRKQSIKSMQTAQLRQNKQEAMNERIQKIRKPRVEKTNQREYDDQYDDFYDYNRKVQPKQEDSESEIQQIPQNPNRTNRVDKDNSQVNRSNHTHQPQTKTYDKRYQKRDQKSQYQQKKQSHRGNNNPRRGGNKGQHTDSRPGKKQYRQK